MWWKLEGRHEKLIKLTRAGHSAGSIGAILGTTRNSVIGYARRKHVPLAHAKGPNKTRINKVPIKAKRVRLKLVIHKKSKAPKGGVAILDLKFEHCRYPLWDDPAPEMKDKRYCGDQVVDGKRWCQDHFKLVSRGPSAQPPVRFVVRQAK